MSSTLIPNLEEERAHVLSGIHPILSGELLAALDRLGHGDELVVADANVPAHRVGKTVIEAADAAVDRIAELERFTFYERAANAQLIVRTGELRPYGNLIVRNGVVNACEPREAAR